MSIPDKRLDPLEAMRVSSGKVLKSLNAKYSIPSDCGVQEVTGATVSHVSNEGAFRVAVSGTSGSNGAIRTDEFFNAEKPLVKWVLYHSDSGQVNQVRRWGLFDDYDGFYFELSNTTIAVGYRSYVTGTAVDTNIIQAAWGNDRYDGSEEAPQLDITNINVYEISFSQRAGEIRFFINGVLVHTIDWNNEYSYPIIRNKRLPLAIDIENTGASSTGSITAVHGSLVDEQEYEPDRLSFGDDESSVLSTGGVPVMSIRPVSTFLSQENRCCIYPHTAIIVSTGSGVFNLVLDGTLTDDSFADVESDVSCAEIDGAATAITGGVIIASYRVFADIPERIDLSKIFNKLGRKLKLKAFPSSDQDTLTFVGVSDSATPIGCVSLVWDEEK